MALWISNLNRNILLRRVVVGFIGLGLVPLGGCITLLPKPGKPAMIAPMAGNAKIDKFDAAMPYSITIDTPTMPDALAGKNVAVILKDGSYAYVDQLHLASAAPDAIQNIILTTFDNANAFLATARGNTTVRTNYELTIDIPHFEVTMPRWGKAGIARIDASVRLIDVNTRAPIAAKTFSATAPAEKGDPIQAAKALENATQSLSVDIMNWLRTTKAN